MLRMFNDPQKDAKSILETVPYRAIRTVWELYFEKHKELLHTVPITPAWRVLTIIAQQGTKLRLRKTDFPLFKSFFTVPHIYLEIIRMLESNVTNLEYGEKIINYFPELQEAAPNILYNPERIVDFLLQSTRGYHEYLIGFIKKHGKWLQEEISKIENGFR
jgi:hypothetical protein